MLIFFTVFLFSALIQLIFFPAFTAALSRKREKQTSSQLPVSVVVCAHDEEPNLKELLPLLLEQEYPSYEIIVVNDRSNDGTYDFLLEQTRRHDRIRMVNVNTTPAHVNGKKFGLTLGIRAAAHEWILLTDADCRPATTKWILSMSEKFDGAQIVLGFSPYTPAPGFLNLFIRFESLITGLQYLSMASLRYPYMGVGRNLAYRKSLFIEKKGFNSFLHVTGGDDDLFVNQHATSSNTACQLDAESIVYSVPCRTWTSFFYQKVRHLSVGRRYRLRHRLLLGAFILSWLLTWFAGLPLIVFSPYHYIVAGIIIIRWLLMFSSIRILVRKSGTTFNYWAIPILDFVFPIYYISTALVALLTRQVRWKK